MEKEEFMIKYSGVKVKFTSYYKYSFIFKGILHNGKEIVVTAGGIADDIYKLRVADGEEYTISSLDPHAGGVFVDGIEIESFYDC